MIKIVLSLSILFLLNACTIKKPHISEYSLLVSASNSQTKSIESSCKNKTLKVLPSSSENSLHSTNMRYLYGRHNIDAFTMSKWSEAPNHFINRAIVQKLQENDMFKVVISSGSRAKNELYLESDINEFLQHFSQDETSSKAELNIRLTLVDAKTEEVIASKTFKESVETTTIDAKGGVVALNKALTLFLDKQLVWLEKSCK